MARLSSLACTEMLVEAVLSAKKQVQPVCVTVSASYAVLSQVEACWRGLDEEQLRMLKAQVRNGL